MDLTKVLAELHQELENLDQAIRSLERLQQLGSRSQAVENLAVESRKPGRRSSKPHAVPARKTTGN